MKNLKQGAIYFADLNPVKGHEQAGFRPVLVLQNDILNKNLSTVIIAPITTNLKAKGYLTTCFLAKSVSGLPQDSVILLYQIRTIDKMRLKRLVSNLSPVIMRQIKEQIAFVF